MPNYSHTSMYTIPVALHPIPSLELSFIFALLVHFKVIHYMQDRKRDTDVQNRLLDSEGQGDGGMFQENTKTCILSIVKQITSPGWMHETSAWTWCTGKTQRDWVEREVGGGIGMGNTCKSMADSFQCMTEPISML